MTSTSKPRALRRDWAVLGCRRDRRCRAHVNAASVSTARTQFPITDDTTSVKGLRLHELSSLLSEAGISKPQCSAEGVFKHLYKRLISQESILSMREAHPKVSAEAVKYLLEHTTVDGGLSLLEVKCAADGTCKIIFSCGGNAAQVVETVLIPMKSGPMRRPRFTLCVSSQVGCAQGCQFCLTGRMGLLKQLSAGQIVEQAVGATRYLRDIGSSAEIENIVFMGMGEPMHNLEAVVTACDVLHTQIGLDFGLKKITVSTVGLVPEFREFVERSGVRLAVSLHATTDEVRDWIVPINRRYPLPTLIGTLEELFPADGERGFVVIEYLLLRGVNDSEEDASRLALLLENIHCVVNLITFNPHAGTPFLPSERAAMKAFQAIVRANNKICTLRESKGGDEMAACGQLGNPSSRPLPNATSSASEPPS